MSKLLIFGTTGDFGDFSRMADLTRGERLQIMLTKQELEALDTWRFERRMPSRASAIRELLKRGLAADGFLSAEPGSQSGDFGVTGRSSGSPTRDRMVSGNMPDKK